MDAFWIGLLTGAALVGAAWGAFAFVLARRATPLPPEPIVVPPDDAEQGREQAGLAGIVPLAFAPVHAFFDVLNATSTEVRALLAPGGHVGILFADIVGSTRLNRRLGDEAWTALLAEHDAVTGGVVRAHGGRVVKRQGDGFMAAFHDAVSAVDAALALQPALARLEGPAGALRLRIGVHHGEVVSKSGDYFGLNVAKAARIAGAAEAGEVLVSTEVVDALDGGIPGTTMVPRERADRLQGIGGRHQLVAVTRP